MDKKVIKINEAKIREMVSKALNEALNEFTDIMKFPPGFVAKKGREWQIDRIKKEAEKHPDLDPNGFMWVGDTLRHNDKKKPKGTPRSKIARMEGESTDQFLKRAAGENERIKAMIDHENGQIFRNIENILERFGVETSDYLSYEVSDQGIVRVINNEDGAMSIEPKQYQDKHGDRIGDYQVHLGSENCPVVKNLVAFAFPDLVKQPFNIADFTAITKLPYVVIHIDGNKANNAASNLKWVEKRKK